MIFFIDDECVFSVKIINWCWSVAVLGAVVGVRLISLDMVYCLIVCSSVVGMFVVCGGVFVGGVRLVFLTFVSAVGLLEEV